MGLFLWKFHSVNEKFELMKTWKHADIWNFRQYKFPLVWRSLLYFSFIAKKIVNLLFTIESNIVKCNKTTININYNDYTFEKSRTYKGTVLSIETWSIVYSPISQSWRTDKICLWNSYYIFFHIHLIFK